MSLSRVKTWIADEVLTASNLNAEFNNILNNALSLISPLTGALDFNGLELILDADGDSSITADTDDRIDFRIGGTDAMFLGHATGNTAGFLTLDPGAFTATANTNIARLMVAGSNALTVPAGTTAIAAGLHVAEPNLTATGTITSAVSLYVADAPTEGGTNNYALWVDAGAVQFDGTLNVTGAVDITGTLTVASNIIHQGDTNNLIGFTTDTQTFTTGGGSRMDITDSGVRLGAANARVTTVLDEDTMSSDSATALVTQQSMKAYADSVGVLPRSYGAGCDLSRDAGDTDHDVNILPGAWRDSTNTKDIVLASEITKMLGPSSAGWVVGDDNGGLDGSESSAGTPDASTWYHVHLIRRNDTGVVDVLFSESATAPTMPTDYDVFRRIGTVETDSSANIIAFSQKGDDVLWVTPLLDVNVSNQGTSSISYALSTPLGVKTIAKLLARTNTNDGVVYLRSLDQSDEAVASQAAGNVPMGTKPLTIAFVSGGGMTPGASAQMQIRTDTSSQIAARGDQASITLDIITLGYIDRRGRDA